jgi:hypothetical protein
MRRSRGLGDVYKRQDVPNRESNADNLKRVVEALSSI